MSRAESADAKASVKAEIEAQFANVEGTQDEDLRLFREIQKGLQGEKQECFPGAPAFFGVPFIKINNWEHNCGFNPLFYVALFIVVGSVTVIASYAASDE